MLNGNVRDFFEIGKAILVGVLFCLVATLAFAFVIRIAELSSAVIAPVNRVIRALAIFLGCLIGLSDNKGLLKGAAAGILIFCLTFVIFSFIGGGFRFSLWLLAEFFFSFLVGAISGTIAVNVHK